MKLSIVTTLYNSAPYIEEFYNRITASAIKITDDYEIIFVNDGSPDNSLEVVVNLYNQDSKVKVIDLSRNFGHHKAMMAGLSHTKGEFIFLIDCDLEESPEWLNDFFKKLVSEKYDVVYGVQKKRKGSIFEKISGEVYYKLLDIFLPIKHPHNITTARLMVKKYVDSLLLFKEKEIVISCLWIITGFKQYRMFVNKKSTSKSTYSLFHKLRHFVNTVTSFSSSPLKFIFYLGTCILISSFFYVLYIFINWLFFLKPISGWSSLIISVWVLGGLNICFIGIIGIYLSKIFLETKQRPNFIIKEIHERK